MILVTGGTGLVGSHLLVQLAASGERVRALKRPTSDLGTVKRVFQHYRPEEGAALFSGIEWVEGDILDIPTLEDAFEGVRSVYHCAAMVSFDPADRERLIKFNVEGTSNIVNLALDHGVEKLCYVSSTAAIGATKNGEPVHEGLQWKHHKKISGYSISKHNAEREVWRGGVEGLNTVIVNPSVILGPGNWEKSSVGLFKNVHDGLPFYTGGANGFVDARDVADAMVRLMNSGINGERFLVVGENLPFKTLFEKIAAELDVKPPRRKAKRWMTEVGWRADGLVSKIRGKKPSITKETAHSAHNSIAYSTDKIEERLSFNFTPLDDTIRNAGDFFREHYGVGKEKAS